jgi:hypothetical protein
MKKIIYCIFILVLLPVISSAAGLLIDDCDKGSLFNKLGGMWCTYNDASDGGTSKVWPPASQPASNGFKMSGPGYGNKGCAVRITGRAGTKLGYDFLGVVMLYNNNSGCPKCAGTDISMYTGVEFKVKGRVTTGQVIFILPYESSECVKKKSFCKSLTGYGDFLADITDQVGKDWQTVRIDFKNDLAQPDWTKVRDMTDIKKVLKHVHSFNWQYKGGKGAKIDLWIDDIKLY